MRFGFRLIIFLCLQCSLALANVPWQRLQAGIDYYHFVPEKAGAWSHIQAFRIDPKLYQLQIASRDPHTLNNSTVKNLSESKHALLGINGGFFSPQFNPIGLRVSEGKLLSPVKPISWWGIFYLKQGQPKIASQSEFQSQRDIEFAVQSGPRLLISRSMPKLKPGVAQRSALGITKQGDIIVLATQNYPMTTEDLAIVLRDTFDCVDALNLDGGSSTQLYANIGAFQFHIPGYANIADAIVVLAKSS